MTHQEIWFNKKSFGLGLRVIATDYLNKETSRKTVNTEIRRNQKLNKSVGETSNIIY